MTERERVSSIENQDFPHVELSKAEQILGVLGFKGIERTDAIFHSEGAINGLIAAMIRPDLFRNIVLDKPAGLIGEDRKPALLGRFLKLMMQETLPRVRMPSDPNNGITTSARVLKYFAGNPVGVLDELGALTTGDITKIIHGLEDQGVMISVMSGIDDPLFSTDKQVAHLRKTQDETEKALPIEGWYTVVGGHNELSLNESKHTRLALNALEGLQRRREKGISAPSSPVL